jgi:Txe/YoeB family toxin of Txe-Axe toxin-antitoxin module
VETISKSTAHWKAQTDELMNKYHPLIKELQNQHNRMKEENILLVEKLREAYEKRIEKLKSDK